MATLGDPLRRLFPERQIYLYSDGRVRTVVLTGARQAQIAGAAVVVAGCVVGAACAAGAGLSALAARPPAPAIARAATTAPASKTVDPRALGELARTVQRRDAALDALIHTLQPASAHAAPAALNISGGPDHFLERVRGEQEQLVASTATLVHARLERLRAAFRTARLDPAAFEHGRPSKADVEGEGGPFIDAADPRALARALDVDAPFAAEVSVAAREALALRGLTRAEGQTPLGLPVDHPEESSGFGLRADPFTGRAAFHPGQDFRGAYGQPIHATAAGVIAFVGQRNGYGNVVEIAHPGGFLTRYGHLSAFKVRRGEPVQAGQLIAAMGSTGRSTGVHLHYEVWEGGVLQNPDRFIRAARSVQQ